MTEPKIPDSSDQELLTETILQNVLEDIRKDEIILTENVLGILEEIQEFAEGLKKPTSDPSAFTIPAPALIERRSVRNETEEKLNDFDIAKSELVSHCFKLMLSEGIPWEDIMREIADRIPGNEEGQKAIKHLEALENLNLKSSQFS